MPCFMMILALLTAMRTAGNTWPEMSKREAHGEFSPVYMNTTMAQLKLNATYDSFGNATYDPSGAATQRRAFTVPPINPACVVKLGTEMLFASVKAAAKDQARNFAARLLVATSSKGSDEIGDMAKQVAGQISNVDTSQPATLESVTSEICESIVGSIISTLRINKLTVGCLTTKGIAFGLSLFMELFSLKRMVCSAITDAVSFSANFFQDKFVRDEDNPIIRCESCCPAFKRAQEANWVVDPCIWQELTQCSYTDQCEAVLKPIREHSGIGSFLSFCECHCCPGGESMVASLDKLPGSGQQYMFTADMPERGDVTAIAMGYIDWASVTEEYRAGVEELLCFAADFASCIRSVDDSGRMGSCDCGHWTDTERLADRFQEASGLQDLVPSCTADQSQWVETEPVYPDGTCEAMGGITSASGCRWTASLGIVPAAGLTLMAVHPEL
mmetsp:Transcript_8111/g.17669  ORF Transcript_8111/g.17669 Transcript_8111/m.17669 type:complete len:444 (-) Transcript_8111:99-1430(-)